MSLNNIMGHSNCTSLHKIILVLNAFGILNTHFEAKGYFYQKEKFIEMSLFTMKKLSVIINRSLYDLIDCLLIANYYFKH